MRLLTISAEVLLLALAAVSLTTMIRAIPFVKAMADRGVKPWGCDVCMSFWSLGLAAVVAATYDLAALLAAVPAHGLAVLLLHRLRPFPALDVDVSDA